MDGATMTFNEIRSSGILNNLVADQEAATTSLNAKIETAKQWLKEKGITGVKKVRSDGRG